MDGYITAAKVVAGTDWAGTFVRMCIPPPRAPAALLLHAAPSPPAKHGTRNRPRSLITSIFWYKIDSAWAIVGSQGIIIIEALFDYAAKDEILGGLKTLGLDSNKVKYVTCSHAHGDHDGGAKLLQDTIPGVHLVYGAEDWEGSIRQPPTWAENRNATSPVTMAWWSRWAMPPCALSPHRAHAGNASYDLKFGTTANPSELPTWAARPSPLMPMGIL